MAGLVWFWGDCYCILGLFGCCGCCGFIDDLFRVLAVGLYFLGILRAVRGCKWGFLGWAFGFCCFAGCIGLFSACHFILPLGEGLLPLVIMCLTWGDWEGNIAGGLNLHLI